MFKDLKFDISIALQVLTILIAAYSAYFTAQMDKKIAETNTKIAETNTKIAEARAEFKEDIGQLHSEVGYLKGRIDSIDRKR